MKWIKSDMQNPLKDAFWVEIITEIRHNKTGEIVVFEDEAVMFQNEEHPDTWIWNEGNYSCDCNRRLFFKRAKGEETKEDWDVPCSDGKYSVNLKNKKDGKIYYQEFEN